MCSNQIAFKQLFEVLGGHRLLKVVPPPAWPALWAPINGNCRILSVVAVEDKTRQ